jgi:putative ABC transport system permease protein
MRNIIPEAGGRFINDPDMAQRRRVVVLGDDVKNQLFGESGAVGRVIMIGEVPFTVVGVMQHKTQNSSYNRRDKDRVFIPASTFSSIYGVRYVNNIIYRPHDPTKSEEVNEQVRQVLAKRYTFDPADKDAIWIWDTAEFDKFFFYFFLAFNVFLGLIGSFTLAVGGIGVANIMYIVVQERVREIGVKRAVGAKRSNILSQFFLETIFIVGLGSSVGFLIAVGITQALAYIPIKEFVGTPEISVEVAIATMVLLSGIGLTAGFLPARRAANLNVVECLRT